MVQTGGPSKVQASPGVGSDALCGDVSKRTDKQKHGPLTEHENTAPQPGSQPVTGDDKSPSTTDPVPAKKKKVWPSKYNKGPFICAYCSKKFRGLLDLTRHERTHTNEKPLLCEECGRGFSCESSLRCHMDVHRDHRPFSCPICNATFRGRAAMNAHSVVHTDLRPFACEICGLRMRQKSSLRKHMRIHTGERPYVCEVCGRGFSVMATCRLHQERHADPNSRVNRMVLAPRSRRRPRRENRTANSDQQEANKESSPAVKSTEVLTDVGTSKGYAIQNSSASNPIPDIRINCNDVVTFTFTPLMVVQTPFGKKPTSSPFVA